MTLSVAGVSAGPLTLTFVWQQGVIEESLATEVVHKVEAILRQIDTAKM